MPVKDAVLKLLTQMRSEQDDAEARATQAAQNLARLASGLTPLAEVNPDQVHAAADDYAAAVRELLLLNRKCDQVRELIT